MIIYPFKSEEYVTKTLSEKKISLDYLDINRKQSVDEFREYKNFNISYASEDFLIMIAKELDAELLTQHMIDLHLVDRMGWYYEKCHKVNVQIFAATESAKIANLRELNPSLQIDSFDKLRIDAYKRKALNVMAGGLALCYYCFEEEFERFLTKANIEKNKWIFQRADLDPKNENIFLLQLSLIFRPNDLAFNRKLFPTEVAMQVLYDIFSSSLKYFVDKNYSMSDYLISIENTLLSNSQYQTIASGLQELNKLYVNKGITPNSNSKVVQAIKEFLDLAKTDSDKLRKWLDIDQSYSKTAIFLLGMLHLHDRLEEQFKFTNIVPILIDELVFDLRDIKINNETIEFEFEETRQNIHQDKKYLYVCNYLRDLKGLGELREEWKTITFTANTLKEFYRSKENLDAIKQHQEKVEIECSERREQLSELQKNQKELEITILELKNNLSVMTVDQANLLKDWERRNNEVIRLKMQIEKAEIEKENIEKSVAPIAERKSKPRKTNKKNKKSDPKTVDPMDTHTDYKSDSEECKQNTSAPNGLPFEGTLNEVDQARKGNEPIVESISKKSIDASSEAEGPST